jgi:hypothetical protein
MVDRELLAEKLALIEKGVRSLRSGFFRPGVLSDNKLQERSLEIVLQVAVDAALEVAFRIVSAEGTPIHVFRRREQPPADHPEMLEPKAVHRRLPATPGAGPSGPAPVGLIDPDRRDHRALAACAPARGAIRRRAAGRRAEALEHVHRVLKGRDQAVLARAGGTIEL